MKQALVDTSREDPKSIPVANVPTSLLLRRQATRTRGYDAGLTPRSALYSATKMLPGAVAATHPRTQTHRTG
jgi:hypothetical protein